MLGISVSPHLNFTIIKFFLIVKYMLNICITYQLGCLSGKSL